MKDLTKRQRDILDFIVKSIKKNGYPPTIREIGAAFGIKSPRGVVCHRILIRKKGFIDWQEGKSRTLRPAM